MAWPPSSTVTAPSRTTRPTSAPRWRSRSTLTSDTTSTYTMCTHIGYVGRLFCDGPTYGEARVSRGGGDDGRYHRTGRESPAVGRRDRVRQPKTCNDGCHWSCCGTSAASLRGRHDAGREPHRRRGTARRRSACSCGCSPSEPSSATRRPPTACASVAGGAPSRSSPTTSTSSSTTRRRSTNSRFSPRSVSSARA